MAFNPYTAKVGDTHIVKGTLTGLVEVSVHRINPAGSAGTRESEGPHVHAHTRPGGYSARLTAENVIEPYSGPIYADGYGRVHVLVPRGPKQREEAVYAMVAFQAPRVATPVSSIFMFAHLNAYEAPTEEWDQSPAFGGVAADTTSMAHYIEYPED